MSQSIPHTIRLFYSYSHADEELRLELEKHLCLLERRGLIAGWHDRKIVASDDWGREIDENLDSAHIILLLISANFISSDYCYGIEMTRALERHKDGETHVVPVILSPVDWTGAPFNKLQALPKNAKPITTWPNRDEAFEDVAKGIRRLCERLMGMAAPAPPPDLTPAAEVTTGLAALIELMRLPQVRETMRTYRTSLRMVSGQIDDMSNYKELHDLLHDLQMHCYDPIVQTLRRPSSDTTIWEDLLTHELTLQGLIDSLNDIGSRETFDQSVILWIKDYLAQASAKLGEAVAAADAGKLRGASFHLSRVLDVQPPLINVRLNAAARGLRLSDLVLALDAVRHQVVALRLDLEEAREFINGVEALDRLNVSLTALIAEHDKWQSIDQDLRQIEPGLAQGFEELEWSWARLRERSAPLYEGSAEAWARNFKTYTERLDGSIASRNQAAVREAFRLYRRQAADRFYRVDKSLKVLCEELRKIGSAPLDAVMFALNEGGGEGA
jgi:hypothetical protein